MTERSFPVPGSHEPGFIESEIIEVREPVLRASLKAQGALGLRFYTMGECSIITCREPAARDGSLLWHLSISHRERNPTWDEIKTARYRLLRLDRCFGMLMPPPEYFVDVHPFCFQLWEIDDPRAPWTAE